MPKNDNRPKVTLACTECKERNYITTKHRVNQRERIELSKYCSRWGWWVRQREQYLRSSIRSRWFTRCLVVM